MVLISPHNYVISRAFLLTELYFNNVAEYNTLLIGMQLDEEIGVKYLKVYGDLKLIVNQIRGEYKVWHEDLIHYHIATINMAEKFKRFFTDHVPRQQNAHANALASLATSLLLTIGTEERVLVVICTIINSPMKTAKFQEETFKLKRFLRFRQVSNLDIRGSLTLTSSCMACCLMIAKMKEQSKS